MGMDRPARETARARAARARYITMGPTRSLDRVHASYTKNAPAVRTLRVWSATFGWVAAGIAFDEEQRAKKRAQEEEAEAAHRAAILRLPLAVREERVARLIAHAEALNDLIAARAEAEAKIDRERPERSIPGGRTGLLARREKALGKAGTTEEAVFDDAVLNRSQALLKQIAQELGQWTEQVPEVLPEHVTDAQLAEHALRRGLRMVKPPQAQTG